MCPEQWPFSHNLWQSALIASRCAQQNYTICEHATKAPPPACYGGRHCILILVLKVGRANYETESPLLLFPVLWRRAYWLYEHLLGFLLHSGSVNLIPQWLAGCFLFPLLPFITPNSYCWMVCSLIASAGIFIKRNINYMNKINDTVLLSLKSTAWRSDYIYLIYICVCNLKL